MPSKTKSIDKQITLVTLLRFFEANVIIENTTPTIAEIIPIMVKMKAKAMPCLVKNKKATPHRADSTAIMIGTKKPPFLISAGFSSTGFSTCACLTGFCSSS